jgi:DNA-directed RNA polymerase subunit RPC12/RpoP
MIEFECSRCNIRIKAPDAKANTELECAACGQRTLVPPWSMPMSEPTPVEKPKAPPKETAKRRSSEREKGSLHAQAGTAQTGGHPTPQVILNPFDKYPLALVMTGVCVIGTAMCVVLGIALIGSGFNSRDDAVTTARVSMGGGMIGAAVSLMIMSLFITLLTTIAVELRNIRVLQTAQFEKTEATSKLPLNDGK